VTEHALDERYARGHVEPVQRGKRKEPGMAVRHRSVFESEKSQAVDRVEIGWRLGDACEHRLDQRIEQVLLAREVMVDAHRLATGAPRPGAGT
jgi:hypothetical protein